VLQVSTALRRGRGQRASSLQPRVTVHSRTRAPRSAAPTSATARRSSCVTTHTIGHPRGRRGAKLTDKRIAHVRRVYRRREGDRSRRLGGACDPCPYSAARFEGRWLPISAFLVENGLRAGLPSHTGEHKNNERSTCTMFNMHDGRYRLLFWPGAATNSTGFPVMTEASAGAPAGAPAGAAAARAVGAGPRAVPAEAARQTASTDSTVRDSAGDAPDSTLGDTGGGETGTESGTQETGVDTGPGDSGGDVADGGIADTGAGTSWTRASSKRAAGRSRMQGLGGCWTHIVQSRRALLRECRDEDRSLRGGLRRRCGQLPGRLLRLGGPANCWPDSGDAAVCCGNLVLTGGQTDAGVCLAAGLVSQWRAAAAFCPDNPPQDCSPAAPPGYVLRLCSATSDCIGGPGLPDWRSRRRLPPRATAAALARRSGGVSTG